MKATAMLAGRYLAEYARRPVNVLLLVLIPIVFVVLYANAMSKVAGILGGSADADAVMRSTVGWSAAFLSGVSAYFQSTGAREADRRLADAGYGTARIVMARLLSSGVLALVAVGASVTTFALRSGMHDVPRAAAGAMLFALVYVAIGTVVGRLVRDDLNGSIIVIFIWILDIFLSPVLITGQAVIPRFFPTYFAGLVIAGIPTNHAGVIGDAVAAVLWAIGGLSLAAWLFGTGLRHASIPRLAGPVVNSMPSSGSFVNRPPAIFSSDSRMPVKLLGHTRVIAGLRAGFHDWRRNRALWLLVVVLPAVFITMAIAVTPDEFIGVRLVENGTRTLQTLSMVDVHASSMAPLAVASLSGLAGMFVALGSTDADRRLLLSGFRIREILAARFGVLAAVAVGASVVSLGVTAVQFRPQQWVPFALGILLLAIMYAIVGAIVGPLVGRIAGVYLLFLLPFIDVGLGQSAMLNVAPPMWARFLPGYGPGRMLLDVALTPDFDEWRSVGVSGIWLIGLGVLCVYQFGRLPFVGRKAS